MPEKKKIKKEEESFSEENSKREEEKSEGETLDELIKEILKKTEEKNKTKEIFTEKEEFDEFLNLFKESAPVLENIAGRQEVTWTRREGQEEKKENLINYSENGGDSEDTKYDEPSREFSQDRLIDVSPSIGLAGTNSETKNQRITFDTPEFQIREKDLMKDTRENYFQNKDFKHKERDMPFEKQDKKYKEFESNQ